MGGCATMEKPALDLCCTNGNSPPGLGLALDENPLLQQVAQVIPETGHTSLLDALQTARLLRVSESWVRRHSVELHAIRLGRLVRFDPSLLRRQFSERMLAGKSLEPE